jgi:hypothetical protein
MPPAAGQVQSPPVQTSPAAQARPHWPQFCSSVAVSVHRPLHSSSGHRQAPPLQARPPVQTVPQAPQFWESVAVFTHVVGETVGQGVGAEVGHWHVPPTQTSFVSGQEFPHPDVASAPQFAASVSVFVQKAPQSFGLGAKHPQAPPEHDSPGRVHGCPHPEMASAPQLSTSPSVSVQNAPQSSSFGATHAHRPPTQPSPTRWHAFPHAPQLFGSFAVSAQRGFRSGHEVAPSHWQTPPAQVPTPQRIPHAPQLPGSVWNVAGSVQSSPQRTCPDGQSSFEDGQPAAASVRAARAANGRARFTPASYVRPGERVTALGRVRRAGAERGPAFR